MTAPRGVTVAAGKLSSRAIGAQRVSRAAAVCGGGRRWEAVGGGDGRRGGTGRRVEENRGDKRQRAANGSSGQQTTAVGRRRQPATNSTSGQRTAAAGRRRQRGGKADHNLSVNHRARGPDYRATVIRPVLCHPGTNRPLHGAPSGLAETAPDGGAGLATRHSATRRARPFIW